MTLSSAYEATGSYVLTSARRSTVTHTIDVGVSLAHVTDCGLRIGDEWAGEWDAGIPNGLPTCKRCLPAVTRKEEAAHAETVAPVAVVTRRWVEDRDTYTLNVDGVAIGTVDSTRDCTGDRKATSADGEIVSPRFTDTTDAERYLLTGIRPVVCVRSFGGYGACIRQDAHPDQCQDAHGHRFTGKRLSTFAEWNLALAMSADIEEGRKTAEIAEIEFLLTGNPWDEQYRSALAAQQDAARVIVLRNRRGSQVASARRWARDARFLRLNGGIGAQVAEALSMASAWRMLAYSTTREMSALS